MTQKSSCPRSLALLVASALALGCAGLGQASPALAVTVVQQEPAPRSETATTLSVDKMPATYGDLLTVSATVELLGPSIIIGKPIDFYLDETKIGSSVLLLPRSSTKVSSIFPVSVMPGAGSATLTARFAGSESDAPGLPGALPSVSAGTTITVAQAPTQTAIVEMPDAPAAFTPIDVTAQVTSPTPGISGTAELLADGSPVQRAAVAADGAVRFAQADVPWGVKELVVAYTGDAAGNWAPSASEPAKFGARVHGTSAQLSLSALQVRALDTVTAQLAVRSTEPGSRIDPRGGIEILVDGEVFFAEASSDDRDATPGDGISRFEASLSGLTTGRHQVSARYFPAPGFGGAEIAPTEVNVRAVETVLTPAQSELRGTPAHPATVAVSVSILEDEPGPDPEPAARRDGANAAPAETLHPSGTVQVFVGDEPLGEPFMVSDGAGTSALAGLPVGTHEINLRFVPAEQGLLRSSATVTAIIAADEPDRGTDGGTESETDGGTDDGATVAPETQGAKAGSALAQTGGAEQAWILLGGAALLLGAGAVLAAAGARRRSS
ncbi:Ig-like domain-containing protein [Leucobacter chromiireducens]|uniref:Ig-like domain-containing protein n=1 Tax=Leucobacter chromiireducens TaxID=283877 RepID=UPI000F636C1A|nr:Ig-like domain-containing protein [Leucobacter chromiireducens]